MDSPLLDVHKKAGAGMGTFFGCSLPAHFTGLAKEYRYAREAVALLDVNYQAFFWLKGSDRVRYLNAITTNNVKDTQPGHGTLGLLLNPQGHILAELRALALEDRFLLTCHAMVGVRTLETLEKFLIMDDATLIDAKGNLGALALEGPLAAKAIYEMCGLKLDAMELHSHREVELGAIPCAAVRSSRFGQMGVELLCDSNKLPALWSLLSDAASANGGGPVGYTMLNTLRLEAGVPWFGCDFDDKVIPHEAALETSHISYTKGCYTGQEIVERVRSRGHVNRRLVGLKFSGNSLPAVDTILTVAGNEVGRVTSAVFSPMHQCNIGMGYVRREHNSSGSGMQWPGGTAEVVKLGTADVRAGS